MMDEELEEEGRAQPGKAHERAMLSARLDLPSREALRTACCLRMAMSQHSTLTSCPMQLKNSVRHFSEI